MAFLWICPMVLSHKANHIGDGTCGYKPADDCDVIFVVNGQTMDATKHGSNHGVYVDLAKVSSGSIAQINVKPKGALVDLYWEVAGQVKIGQPCVVTSNPNAAFCVATLAMDTQTVSVLYVFLSRLQDCTEKVTYLLNTLPTPRSEDAANRTAYFPLWRNPLPKRGNLNYANAPRPYSATLPFVLADPEPIGANVVFEVMGPGTSGTFVPKMLAVYWPSWVPRQLAASQSTSASYYPKADATSFLIFYHPNTNQNKPGYYMEQYPESFDYLYHILWANTNYCVDPLQWSIKGIPYQIAQASKRIVSVVPCLCDTDQETGHFNDGNFVVEALEEIQSQMLRRNQLYLFQPAIERVALAGFSAGTGLVANTLGFTRTSQFFHKVLKEVYMFDPHINDATVVTNMLSRLNWFLTTGTPQEQLGRIGRFYTQCEDSAGAVRKALRTFVSSGGGLPPGVPPTSQGVWITDSSNAARTGAVLPRAIWHSIDASGASVGSSDGRDVHQFIPAMMLTDALQRSDFGSR